MVIANNELVSKPHILASVNVKRAARRYDLDGSELTNEILAIAMCTTFHQVHASLFSITSSLGFDAFLYRGRFKTGSTRYIEQIASNYNPSWRQRYENQEYVQVDPTVTHACSSLSPLLWSDAMYTNPEQHNFKEEALQYGIAAGATFPVHSRNGDFAMLNLSLSSSDAEARQHTRSMLTWGALLAAITHETVTKIVKDQNATRAPRLTKRETEVLRWIAEGKSNWEIARLVNISEHGVSHHVRNILLKFDVSSRHLAVAQAQVFGLL